MERSTHGVIEAETICDNAPAIVFWTAAIALSFWYLGARELWGPEERWAEIVREMHLTGGYFHYLPSLFFPWIPLVAASLILVGGIVIWQQGIMDTYRTLRPFALEIRRQTQDHTAEIAFLHPMEKRMLFYLDSNKPTRSIQTADELEDFLGSPAEAKVVISSVESHEQLVSLGQGKISPEATVKERIHPWETQKKKYEAWIVADAAK